MSYNPRPTYREEFRASHDKRDMAILERVQQGARKMMRGLEYLSNKERLKKL